MKPAMMTGKVTGGRGDDDDIKRAMNDGKERDDDDIHASDRWTSGPDMAIYVWTATATSVTRDDTIIYTRRSPLRTPATPSQRAAPPEAELERAPGARRRGLRERAEGPRPPCRSPDELLQPARGVPANVARTCTAGSRSEPPEDPLVRRVGAPKSSVVKYIASSSSSPPTCTTNRSVMSPFAMTSTKGRDDASGEGGRWRGAGTLWHGRRM